jgi:hypothetical protein
MNTKPKLIKQFTIIQSEEFDNHIIVKTCESNADWITISQGIGEEQQQDIFLPKESIYLLREVLESFLN